MTIAGRVVVRALQPLLSLSAGFRAGSFFQDLPFGQEAYCTSLKVALPEHTLSFSRGPEQTSWVWLSCSSQRFPVL